ncbi:GNAT family N-acetyltransferase [Vreelandella stevensii]|uniref:GNAT family N-acetyltransferase n=1 Tax=Halomonadaceae TaxID=28256 RepID=UPI000301AA33|nr:MULTISPECIES: GNAT family N-acetyltransferase [Halomonas]
MTVRAAERSDIAAMAEVYQACFPREKNHAQWIEASFNAYPRGVYYVVEVAGVVRGYILWCVKNGFREKSIIELEQIGIHPDAAGQGLGKRLIVESLAPFKTHVRGLGCGVGAVMVTTSEGNFAEKLYQSTLGVSRAAVVSGYGAGDEVILYNPSMA